MRRLVTAFSLLGLFSAAQAQDAAALQARSLAATCANCHGSAGAARGDMPSLAGMPAATLLAKMAAFKDGSQPSTLMQQLAKGYSDEQMRLIAGFYAAQAGAQAGAQPPVQPTAQPALK